MYQEKLNGKLKISYKQEKVKNYDRVLFFSETGEYMSYKEDENEISILDKLKNELDEFIDEECIYAFEIEGENYYLYPLTNEKDKPKFNAVSRNQILRNYPENESYTILSAWHIFSWYQNTRYCGRCGNKLDHKDGERAKVCSHCDTIYYPQIAPAVIVAIENEDKLLMTKYANRLRGRYALVAGFVEIGETPEDAIVREVSEEVGLEIKEIEYFGSQPWGINGGLLLGYKAKLSGSDEVTLDHNELAEAVWKSVEDIENIQVTTKTLTGTLITDWLNKQYKLRKK